VLASGSIASALGASSPDSRPSAISRVERLRLALIGVEDCAYGREDVAVGEDLRRDGVELTLRDIGIVGHADADGHHPAAGKRRLLLDAKGHESFVSASALR
jgi:hypothetical protein